MAAPRSEKCSGVSLEHIAASAAAGGWVGARLFRAPMPSGHASALRDLAVRLAALGFQPVSPAPPPARGPSPDRHVAVLVARDDQAAVAACWMRQLTAASARGHLVLDLRRSHWRPASSAYGGTASCRACARGVGRDLARAGRLLLDCRLDRAEARLSGLAVDFALRRVASPPEVRALTALVQLCEGRFEEARREVDAMPRGVGRAVRALVAWATVDRGTLVDLYRRRPDRRLRLLMASLSAELGDVGPFFDGPSPALRLVPRGGRLPPRPPTWRQRVDRLLTAEACWSAGRRADALGAIGDDWRQATPLEQVLAAWLRARVLDDRSARADLGRTLVRLQAAGVRRLGMGSLAMQLLHVVPDLLHQVNESEDELAALGRACAWCQEHCQASAAGFLDVTHGAILAGGPAVGAALSPAERRDFASADRLRVTARPDGLVVSAPVRYAGVRIGVIVIVGPAAREATLSEAALNVAALCAPAVRARLDALTLRGDSHARTREILGRSPAITGLREAIARAAQSPYPVLIEGESGSGKELVARAIHRLSPRRERRFAAINCAALTDELAETELFGHARGAFTGAIGPRAGLFEEAHLGTLFLDEAADLSARTQARLLRALQEREVRRLGENTPRAVDVRIVAASNRPLAEAAAAGRFRDDLLFRLAVIRITVPPLRERPEDVSLLALAFWRTMAAELSTRAMLGPDALSALARHSWPGNVRELQNVMAALAVSAPARGRVAARHVDRVLAQTGRQPCMPVRSLDSARLDCERRTIAAALARHGGRRAAAARELGLSRQGLTKAIKRLQLSLTEDEPPAQGVA